MRRAFGLMFGAALLAACGGPADVEPGASDTAAATTTAALLAASCSGCHSADDTAIPSLEGVGEAKLRAALGGYKSDADGTTVMHRLARGYSDAEMDAIAAYLAGEAR